MPLDPAGLVGGKRCQPAVGQFRLAHDRLLLGMHLGEPRALAGNVVAHVREPRFQFAGMGKLGDGALGLGLAGGRFVAAGGKARARFGERR